MADVLVVFEIIEGSEASLSDSSRIRPHAALHLGEETHTHEVHLESANRHLTQRELCIHRNLHRVSVGDVDHVVRRLVATSLSIG